MRNLLCTELLHCLWNMDEAIERHGISSKEEMDFIFGGRFHRQGGLFAFSFGQLHWDRQGLLQVRMQGFEDCPLADPFLPGNPGPGQPVPVELPDQRPVGSRKAVQGRREEKVSFPTLQGVQRVLSRCRQDLQHVSSFFPHGAEIQGPMGLISFRLVALPALSAIVCSLDLADYMDKCFPDPDQILFTV